MGAFPTKMDGAHRAVHRAASATTVFAAAGAVAVWHGVPDWSLASPLGLSYALLVGHTYFSVRCFSAITPSGLRGQQVFDALLVIIYLALAASIGNVMRFAWFAALLFGIATLKYATLIERAQDTHRLTRKLRVDAVGTVVCVLAFAAASSGHARIAGWSLFAANIVANVYLLWWRPLYR